MKNIEYSTPEIERFFSQHRLSFDQFYDSEKSALIALAPAPDARVLDVGCGCGGLGLALRDRFRINNYTGVEINAAAAARAVQLNPAARIIHGDFLVDGPQISSEQFDLVFSLSCIDWNVTFPQMLAAAWQCVKPGGWIMLSLRLTTDEGVDDMARSYQYINYEGRKDGERAAYVVLNAAQFGDRLRELGAGSVIGHGYYGAPSQTAVTPFTRLCFVALAVRKPTAAEPFSLAVGSSLPGDVAGQMFREL